MGLGLAKGWTSASASWGGTVAATGALTHRLRVADYPGAVATALLIEGEGARRGPLTLCAPA